MLQSLCAHVREFDRQFQSHCAPMGRLEMPLCVLCADGFSYATPDGWFLLDKHTLAYIDPVCGEEGTTADIDYRGDCFEIPLEYRGNKKNLPKSPTNQMAEHPLVVGNNKTVYCTREFHTPAQLVVDSPLVIAPRYITEKVDNILFFNYGECDNHIGLVGSPFCSEHEPGKPSCALDLFSVSSAKKKVYNPDWYTYTVHDDDLPYHFVGWLNRLLDKNVPETRVHICAVCNARVQRSSMAQCWNAQAEVPCAECNKDEALRGSLYKVYYRSGVCGACQTQLSLYQMAIIHQNAHIAPMPSLAPPLMDTDSATTTTARQKRARTDE